MTNNSLNIPYIVLSGTVLIGIVLTVTAYQPMTSEVIRVKSELEENKLILNDKQELLRGMQSRVNALNAQREHENRLNVVLPRDNSLEDALRILHVAVQDSGGVINNIMDQSAAVQTEIVNQELRGEVPDIPENVTPLAFGVDFTGTYRELRVFLEKIEQSPRIMDVMNLTINKGETAELISASMDIRFYKYNLE